MPAGLQALTSRLYTNQFYRVIDKTAKDPQRIGTAPHTCIDTIGKSPFPVHYLPSSLLTDNGLKIGDHLGKRVSATCSSKDIVGVIHVTCPIA